MSEQIDRAVIKIEADASSVPGQIEPAKKAVAGGLTDSLKKARESAFGLLGALGSIVGTVTGFFALGRTIRTEVVEALKSGADRGKELIESLDLSNAEQSLAAMQKRLEELNATLAENADSGSGEALNTIIGRSTAKAMEEREKLVTVMRSLSAQIAAPSMRKADKERADARKSEQAATEAAAQALRQLQLEMADDELRIKMETADRVDALRKKGAESQTAFDRQVYENAAKLAELLGAKRLAAFADEQKKKKDAADKAAKEDLDRFTKLAAAQADAIERTLRRINQEAASQSNLDQFVAMGNRIERLLGAIERQRPG